LDLDRSRFGQIPAAKGLVIQIEHHEPKIRIVSITTTEKGETRDVLELTTDSKLYA